MSTMWGLTARGICEYDGKILLLKIRSKSAHDAGKWEIPGGKVKKCEYFDEGLKENILRKQALKLMLYHYIMLFEKIILPVKQKRKSNQSN